MKFSWTAGHSEKDTPGKQDPEGRKEWWYNDKIVRFGMELLGQYEGVVQKRFDDPTGKRDIPLQERTNNINAWGSDCHIDVHLNAFGASGWTSAGGTETYIAPSRPKEAAELAHKVQANLVKELGFANRGVKTANFHMVTRTKMTAILPEIAFMTNKNEAYAMRKEENQRKAAKAIVDVLVSQYKLKKKEVVPVSKNEEQYPSKIQFLSEWVKEMGISDGKNPYAPATLAYVWEVAHKLYYKLNK